MSLATLNNHDSGLDARTKINAAIAAVNELGGGGCDVQDFSAAGTWHKPAGAKVCRIILIGQGGNGGYGTMEAGGGGGPGGVTIAEVSAQTLGATQPVTVAGPFIQFAGFSAAHGVTGGPNAPGSGSWVRFSHPPSMVGQPNGGSTGTATDAAPFACPSGGGSGGDNYISANGFEGGKMLGMDAMDFLSGGSGGGVGAAGSPGYSWDLYGTGGGGGGLAMEDISDSENMIRINGGNGGAGGNFGGGGGGGGAACSPNVSGGQGGIGGLPLCRIITWF